MGAIFSVAKLSKVHELFNREIKQNGFSSSKRNPNFSFFPAARFSSSRPVRLVGALRIRTISLGPGMKQPKGLFPLSASLWAPCVGTSAQSPALVLRFPNPLSILAQSLPHRVGGSHVLCILILLFFSSSTASLSWLSFMYFPPGIYRSPKISNAGEEQVFRRAAMRADKQYS